MNTVKLEKDGKIIERSKVDFEQNEGNWKIRGWSLYEGKPKAEPKPIEEPKKAKPKKKGK